MHHPFHQLNGHIRQHPFNFRCLTASLCLCLSASLYLCLSASLCLKAPQSASLCVTMPHCVSPCLTAPTRASSLRPTAPHCVSLRLTVPHSHCAAALQTEAHLEAPTRVRRDLVPCATAPTMSKTSSWKPLLCVGWTGTPPAHNKPCNATIPRDETGQCECTATCLDNVSTE